MGEESIERRPGVAFSIATRWQITDRVQRPRRVDNRDALPDQDCGGARDRWTGRWRSLRMAARSVALRAVSSGIVLVSRCILC